MDTTNAQRCSVIGLLFLSIATTSISAAAGRCYQCNARNALCGITVNETLKIDGTPCNGQCYTRVNRADEQTVYRGCSWEHGFMTAQDTDALIIDDNSVWLFCDTPYCNNQAARLFNTICYQPICNYLQFPADCKLPNADVTCGLNCGNKLCAAKSRWQPYRHRNKNRNRLRTPKDQKQ